jgi:hypothetical protein
LTSWSYTIIEGSLGKGLTPRRLSLPSILVDVTVGNGQKIGLDSEMVVSAGQVNLVSSLPTLGTVHVKFFYHITTPKNRSLSLQTSVCSVPKGTTNPLRSRKPTAQL